MIILWIVKAKIKDQEKFILSLLLAQAFDWPLLLEANGDLLGFCKSYRLWDSLVCMYLCGIFKKVITKGLRSRWEGYDLCSEHFCMQHRHGRQAMR